MRSCTRSRGCSRSRSGTPHADAAARSRPPRREAALLHEANGRSHLRLRADGACGEAPNSRQSSIAESLDLYFILGYVPGPRTIFAGVEQLRPGTIAEWRPGGALRHSSYWAPGVYPRRSGDDEEVLVEEMVSLVGRAVESRMVSDVPLGVFLSGGVDSSLSRRTPPRSPGPSLMTFSVDYDVGSVSETAPAAARRRGDRHRHHAFTLTEGVSRARPPSRSARPAARRPAFVALSALSEFARRHVTVALGGEGADELFGGYPRYRWLSGLPRTALPEALATALGVPGGWSRARRLAARRWPRPTPAAAHLGWISGSRLELRDELLGPRLEAMRGSPPPRRSASSYRSPPSPAPAT